MMSPSKNGKSLLINLLLLGLLFQVQTVFACQMVESHRGLASDCCCEEMIMPDGEGVMLADDGGCCDLESTLSLKGSDDDSASILQVRLLPDHPEALLAFVLVSLSLLPEPTAASSGLADFRDKPGDPGSLTWLETRRLRV